jgi:hypothetical protein
MLKNVIFIFFGLSGIEPLLGFLNSTLTFKTSIQPLGYGDYSQNFVLYDSIVSFVKTKYKTPFKYFRSGIIYVQN